MLSKESQPCTVDERTGYDDCLFGYVEDQIGCSAPWWSSVARTEGRLPVCNSSGQYHDLSRFSHKVLGWSPKQVFERIGCTVKCDRVEFSSVPYSRIVKDDAEGGGRVSEEAWVKLFSHDSQLVLFRSRSCSTFDPGTTRPRGSTTSTPWSHSSRT